MTEIIHKKRNKTLAKISIAVLFPCLILLIFILSSLAIFRNTSMQSIKNECSYKLEAIYKENEINIQNINSAINFITANDRFANFVKNTSGYSDDNETKYAQSILSTLKSSSQFIDSTVIVNRGTKKVYSPTNTADFDTYFDISYIYNDYNKQYWQKFKTPISGSVILPPTTVTHNGVKKNIIPIIYTQVNKIRTSNLIIVNINIGSTLETSETTKITPNSRLYMINKQTGSGFSADESHNAIFENDLLNRINDSAENFFTQKHTDMGKSLFISYSPSVNHFGYSYCVIVPYSDINAKTNKLLFVFIFLMIIFVSAAAVSVYFAARRIYTPIDEIARMFPSDSSSPDKFDFIRDSIVKVLNSNDTLTEHYSNSLPLLHEKYLVDLLNSNESYTQNYDECPVKFKYDYFCSVVIKFRQTPDFYKSFDNNEAARIKSGIYTIVQSVFNDKYDSYVMPCETDTLYVLLNLKDDTQRDSIVKLIQTINDLFESDHSLIRIHVGLGMIRKGIDGLKKSHTEAVNSISIVKSSDTINLKGTSETKDRNYRFSITSENSLTNILLTGNTEKAHDFIENLISDNKNIPENNIKELYARIMLVILRVMNSKHIDTPSENTSDIEYVEEAMHSSVRDMKNSIDSLLNLISENSKKSSAKIDSDRIIEYINTHFSEDINLEQLADIFNTTPKYISKLIKDKHDINFVNYLAGIRVEHAKELLACSKKKLTDIYEMCGFNNRNTFVRTFKRITDMTPSEYRSSESAKKDQILHR